MISGQTMDQGDGISKRVKSGTSAALGAQKTAKGDRPPYIEKKRKTPAVWQCDTANQSWAKVKRWSWSRSGGLGVLAKQPHPRSVMQRCHVDLLLIGVSLLHCCMGIPSLCLE